MFRIPSTLPEPTAKIEELVDYLEWECVIKKSIPILSSLKPILISNDEINIGGIEDDSDQLNNKADDIVLEIQRRNSASNSRYPFFLENKGYTLSIKTGSSPYYWIYLYLLLSTRLNMTQNKTWDSIDGTKILEKLSSLSAKGYFGERAESMVFGTAVVGGFQSKVSDLINKIGEGHSYLNRDLATNAKDDKLDIVVWKNFSDRSRSKLIGFGQCKTGTTWDDKETIELQPSDFCKKWFRDDPVVYPIKMFFTSQYFPLDSYVKTSNAGLVFDRSRIIDYLPASIEAPLLDEITRWCTAAINGCKNKINSNGQGKKFEII